MTAIVVLAGVDLEPILIGFVATFLTVATVWIIWYLAEKADPDEVGQLQFYLTFIVVIIPFVMLLYFGLDAIIDDAVETQAGWPPELPLSLPPEAPLLAVVYIGLTVWLGLRWRKLVMRHRGIPRSGAADRDESRQATGGAEAVIRSGETKARR